MHINVGPVENWENEKLRPGDVVSWIEPAYVRALKPSRPGPFFERYGGLLLWGAAVAYMLVSIPGFLPAIAGGRFGELIHWIASDGFVVLLFVSAIVVGIYRLSRRSIASRQILLFSNAVVRSTEPGWLNPIGWKVGTTHEVIRFQDIESVHVFPANVGDMRVPVFEVRYRNGTAVLLGGTARIEAEKLKEYFRRHHVAVE